MSANREAKELVVQEIQEKLERSKSAVLVDYIGLTVEEVTELRNQFRAAQVEFKVLKNTLISRAANKLEIEGLNGLAGPTAIAFSYDDPTAGPKVIKSFIKKAKKTEIKCGLLGKDMMDAKQVENLAEIPNKDVLVAMLLGVMNGPVRGLATALNGIPRGLVCALNAIKEQKESA